MKADAEPLLSVRALSVAFSQNGRETLAVDRVSFDIRKGETIARVFTRAAPSRERFVL